MEKAEITSALKDYLEEQHYNVVDVHSDCTITIRHEMMYVHIIQSSRDNDFVTIMVPGIEDVDQDNIGGVMQRMMHINETQKVCKAYITDDEVTFTFEFFFRDIEDLKFQVDKGLDVLSSVRGIYRDLKEQ